jgi:hypothetical protein
VDDAEVLLLDDRFRVSLRNGGGRRVTFAFECDSSSPKAPAVYRQDHRLRVLSTDTGFTTEPLDVPIGNPTFWIQLPKEASHAR